MKLPNSLTIAEFITSQTSYSRRDIMNFIQNDKVKVNGKIIKSIGFKVNTIKDKVLVNREVIRKKVNYCYYKMNKPKGMLSTMEDPKKRSCIGDEIRKKELMVVPVGRLDRNTTGLILLTNDGALSERLMHPRYKLNKRYNVGCTTRINHTDLERLKAGIILEDGPICYENICLVDEKVVSLSVKEGRNRLIRRTFEQLGYDITSLKRVAIGPIELTSLKNGDIVSLKQREITGLLKLF